MNKAFEEISSRTPCIRHRTEQSRGGEGALEESEDEEERERRDRFVLGIRFHVIRFGLLFTGSAICMLYCAVASYMLLAEHCTSIAGRKSSFQLVARSTCFTEPDTCLFSEPPYIIYGEQSRTLSLDLCTPTFLDDRSIE